jgi:hypothetical protein
MMLAGLLGLLQEVDATAPPRARGWGEFPVFVWRERYKGQPLPAELAEPFGGVILMREEDSGWARERGLSYLVWNVAGRDALHLDADEAWNERVEKWIATRDEELLVREPCLSDPETMQELFTTLDRTIAKHGEFPGLGFVLGDEVSLTPNGDPFDLCRCGLCEAAWKEHARSSGLPERAPLTDEVRLALLEGDFSLLGTWLERRRFDQGRMLALLQRLAEQAGTRERPTAVLGLVGATAFGGLDLAALARIVDVLEAYPVPCAREQLDALRAPARLPSFQPFDATVGTLFLEGESPQGAAWLAWESWMRGANGLVLWSDAVLAADDARQARLATAVVAIRQVEERCRMRDRRPRRPVGLLHDPDSIALSWLRDALLDGPTWPRRRASHQAEHGTRERALRMSVQACLELGWPPPAFPLESLETHAPDVLVVIEALALAPADVEQLEAFLDRGKKLVVVGSLGWVDRGGVPWTTSVLERLRERAQERVWSVDAMGATTEALRSLLVAAGVLPPGVPSGVGLGSGWNVTETSARFVSCTWGLPGERLLVALPAAPTSAARACLEPRELPRSPRIEWLHPRQGGRLEPGDAAVFLVHPEKEQPPPLAPR